MKSRTFFRQPGSAWTYVTAVGLAALMFSAQAIAADPIRLGAPIPTTGPFSSDGQAMEMGLNLAVKDLNESGGLLGREVELLVFDIGDLTPDKLQAAAAFLVERNSVDVLINGYGGMGPDIPAFCPYALPYIHNDATSNVVELRDRMNCGNIFMGSDIDFKYGEISFNQMTSLDRTYPNQKMAIIHGPYDWELNNTQGAQDAAEAAGWEVVVKEEVPYDTKQWRGILSKLHESDPSIIYMELLDPASVKSFIDQFLDDPVKGAILYAGYTVSVPAFQEIIAGGGAEGVLGMTLSAHRNDEKGQAFAAKWRDNFGEEPPMSIGAQIYDEVMLWATAVEKVGAIDNHDAIAQAIRDSQYEGITGKFHFNEQQYIDAGDDTLPAHLIQAQDSKQVQVMIGSQTIAPFQEPVWAQ